MLLVLPLLADCHSMRPHTPLPLELTFVGAPSFLVQGQGTAGTAPAPVCRITRVSVQFLQARGDTIFFSGLVSHAAPSGEARCARVGPGHIALAQQQQVRVLTGRESGLRAVLLGVATMWALSVVLLMAFIANGAWVT